MLAASTPIHNLHSAVMHRVNLKHVQGSHGFTVVHTDSGFLLMCACFYMFGGVKTYSTGHGCVPLCMINMLCFEAPTWKHLTRSERVPWHRCHTPTLFGVAHCVHHPLWAHHPRGLCKCPVGATASHQAQVILRGCNFIRQPFWTRVCMHGLCSRAQAQYTRRCTCRPCMDVVVLTYSV